MNTTFISIKANYQTKSKSLHNNSSENCNDFYLKAANPIANKKLTAVKPFFILYEL
jgi:hypothetical protein